MDIYLIRHTKVKIPPGICYGISDIELADSFEEELIPIKKLISNAKGLKIISSPLKRCAILSNNLTNNDFLADNRLSEMNFGDWELMSWDKISSEYMELYPKWVKDYVNVAPPNGENFKNLYHRAIDVFNEITSLNTGNYAFITHGGTIRAIIANILKIPLKKAFSLDLSPGCVININIDNEYKVIKFLK